MNFIVQDNLFNEDAYEDFIQAAKQLGTLHIVKVRPFIHTLDPEPIVTGPTLVFGSTTLVQIAQEKPWSPGIFWSDGFNMTSATLALGEHMLNLDAKESRLEDVLFNTDCKFIRPVGDLKEFAGIVMNKEDFDAWKENTINYGDVVNKDTKVIVAEPKRILAEFRCFVVDNVLVDYSQYKSGTLVRGVRTYRPDVEEFVRQVIQIYKPDNAFVIDIAETSKGLKVIEFNCINASGFYACDMYEVLKALVKFSHQKAQV